MKQRENSYEEAECTFHKCICRTRNPENERNSCQWGYMGDDGSLCNEREAFVMDHDSGIKAKAIPKTVVSFSE